MQEGGEWVEGEGKLEMEDEWKREMEEGGKQIYVEKKTTEIEEEGKLGDEEMEMRDGREKEMRGG